MRERTAPVAALPRLGTSWYARGVGYWARRTGQALFLVVLMGVMCGVAVSAYRSMAASFPAGARTAADVAEAVLAVAGVVWGWIAGRRRHREACAQASDARSARREQHNRNRRAPGLIMAGRLIAVILVPVVPGVVAAATAYLLAMVFVGETPNEIGARRELAAKGLPAYPPGAKGAVAG